MTKWKQNWICYFRKDQFLIQENRNTTFFFLQTIVLISSCLTSVFDIRKPTAGLDWTCVLLGLEILLVVSHHSHSCSHDSFLLTITIPLLQLSDFCLNFLWGSVHCLFLSSLFCNTRYHCSPSNINDPFPWLPTGHDSYLCCSTYPRLHCRQQTGVPGEEALCAL